MAQTSVQSNALHPLHVLTNALVEEICILLGGLTVFDITLTIEHPGWDFELQRIADHSNDFVHLVCCQFSSSLVHVDVALLANDIGDASANSTNCSQGIHHLLCCTFGEYAGNSATGIEST